MKRTVRALSSLLLAGVLALGAAPAYSAAKLAAPFADSTANPTALARKAQLINDLLRQYHYRDIEIDDKLAQQSLDRYLEALDRDRYYFLASDVSEFRSFANKLDNDLLAGRMDRAKLIFERYRQRVAERTEHAISLLDRPLRFSGDDRLELDRSEMPWAASTGELDALWRKRVQHDILTLRFSDQSEAKIREILEKRYRRVSATVADYTDEEIFEGYANAWAVAYDPHTIYMSPRMSEDFDIHMRLSLQGIGAMLKTENDLIEVVELVAGGPAEKTDQLHPGDRIIGVGQSVDGEIVDVVGWRLTDVVEQIRGRKGTTVRLQVLPKSAGADAKPRIVSIVRDEVKLEDQAAQARTLEIEQDGRPQKIGVIKLPAFYMDFAAAERGDEDYRSTTRDVRRLIEQLKSEGVDGLVIDLRGNGGGSLQEVSELTGLFVDTGPVVQVRRVDGTVEVLQDLEPGVVYDGPLAVMVDRFSASASEIFAAAIQDYGRGVIIGERTFGKGTVQTLVDLDRYSFDPKTPSGRLKLTIAKFYRINGASTQLRGVTPDLELPSMLLDKDMGESSQDTALPWDEIRSVGFQRYNRMDELLPLLRKRHAERAADSNAYQALLREFAQLKTMQERTSVPLTEEARRAERERAEQAQLEAVNARLAAYGLAPIDSLDELDEDTVPDTLLREAAAVVADLSVLRTPGTATVSNWSKPAATPQ